MTVRITTMTDADTPRGPAEVAETADEAGLGALRTERGNLPLGRIDISVEIIGLTSQVELTQDFVNTHDVPLEASYVFPLPDRAAVTQMTMKADGRVVEAELQERGSARRAYDEAVTLGRRASVAEEERPNVFTMRVGTILPGERVSVALTMVNPLAYVDGEATFLLPLVVAPRYIPGEPLTDVAVGDGCADDTDAVPDASRITPPVLLPGFPLPVPLSIDVGIDAAGLALSEVHSSLPVTSTDQGRIRVQPGERPNRDFVLRLRYGGEKLSDAMILVPDSGGDEGTFQLTVLPPVSSVIPRPRDVVLLLDRSGSMGGWKMVAARRAAARIVDTLTRGDRFAVLTFCDETDRPAGLPDGLVPATDRNRYRAVEHLAGVQPCGDTELFAPLRQALSLLRKAQDGNGRPNGSGRDSIVVLVTDGQVGNEDQLLAGLTGDLRRVRLHAVGIDQAVNAGLLGRLAAVGGGRCELVESEDRLDEAMAAIHRRIVAPLAHSLSLQSDGMTMVEGTMAPARLPDLFPGVPLVVSGRYRGSATGSLTLRGKTGDDKNWSVTTVGQSGEAAAVTAQWARLHLRDLEDRYASARGETGNGSPADLANRIVGTSLRFAVLCRFTAYVAVDSRIADEGQTRHRVVQPVETPAGWAPAPVAGADDLLLEAVDAQQAPGVGGVVPTSSAKAPAVRQPSAAKPVPVKTAQVRTVKLRNVIAILAVGVVLLGGGWFWSLGADGSLAPTHDGLQNGLQNGVVGGKLEPRLDDSGGIARDSVPSAGLPATKGGTSENTVATAPAPLSPPEAPSDTSTYKRDIVSNGSMQLVVAEPAAVADQLIVAVTGAGGRVDSRSERSISSSPVVDLVLRIPSDKLDGVLLDVKKLGTVKAISINHTDVTSQRVDLDARIDALQTSVRRLLELMSKASNTSDLLAAESSLTQRQAELDSLRAQRTTLRDEISYATISVNLSTEPPAVTHVGFIGSLEHGWRSLLSTGYSFLLGFGFLLPWLALLALPLIAVVLLARRLQRSPAAGTDADENPGADHNSEAEEKSDADEPAIERD